MGETLQPTISLRASVQSEPPKIFRRSIASHKEIVAHPGCHPERPERSDGSRRTCFLEIWRRVGSHRVSVPCLVFPIDHSLALRSHRHQPKL